MESLVFNSINFSLIILIIVSLVYLYAQFKNDNSVIDITYGLIFLVSSSAALLITQTYSILSVIMLICIALWSLRLSIRIFKKNFGKKEDQRYANWRIEWLKKGRLYFLIRSYLQINILQGVTILFVSLPFILSLTTNTEISLPFLVAGLVVFFSGLSIETVADLQLDRFIARKKAGLESSPIMTQGLFRFSRRPNYFGETLIWWGLAIMVLPLPLGYLALFSPLLITFIVTRITGPILEKIFLVQYPTEYAAYQKRTSYFIPLPPCTPN